MDCEESLQCFQDNLNKRDTKIIKQLAYCDELEYLALIILDEIESINHLNTGQTEKYKIHQVNSFFNIK